MYDAVFLFALWGTRYLWNLGESDSTLKEKNKQQLLQNKNTMQWKL